MKGRDSVSLRARESRAPEPSGEIKVIAAATDFRDAAVVALRRAAQLCRATGAKLHLMHIMSPAVANAASVFSALGVQSDRLGRGAAHSRLHRAAARLFSEFEVHVETHLGVGDVHSEIGALARKARADLIVVGNHRRNLVAEVLGTGTALRVQRRTDIPLLAVSAPVRRPYASLLLVSDLSAHAACAGQRARRFFPHSKLTILHATESLYAGTLFLANVSDEVREEYRRRAQFDGMERLRVFAREASLDAALRVELAHPTLAAQRLARNLDVDLVVLRPTRRWLTSGVAYHLTADPPCDLLLMP